MSRRIRGRCVVCGYAPAAKLDDRGRMVCNKLAHRLGWKDSRKLLNAQRHLRERLGRDPVLSDETLLEAFGTALKRLFRGKDPREAKS